MKLLNRGREKIIKNSEGKKARKGVNKEGTVRQIICKVAISYTIPLSLPKLMAP